MSGRRRLSPDERRAELLDAAEAVIREMGSAARVEDIVQRAGAAKGTFFVYFPAWRDLIMALRERTYEAFAASSSLPSLEEGAPDWAALIEQLAEEFVDFSANMGGLHEAIFHGELEMELKAADDGAQAWITNLLRAGQADGYFAGLDAESGGRILFAMADAAADAVLAGAPRAQEIATLRLMVRRCLTGPQRDAD